MAESTALRLADDLDFDLQFPPLPRSVSRVCALLEQAEEARGLEALIQIVRTDPVIATALLRRVNSAYYGTRREVASVEQAVRLLGFQEVCNLVLSISLLQLRDVLQHEEQSRIFEQILRTSFAAAYFSHLLAGALSVPSRAAAFAAGLFVGAGRLVFLYNAPETYEALWHAGDGSVAPSLDEERAIFGVSHSALSHAAVRSWKLPEEVCAAVHYYRSPGSVEQDKLRGLAYATGVAAAAADQLTQVVEEARAEGADDDEVGRSWRFNAPPCLSALEEDLDVSHGVPLGLVEGYAEQALAYVGAMAIT